MQFNSIIRAAKDYQGVTMYIILLATAFILPMIAGVQTVGIDTIPTAAGIPTASGLLAYLVGRFIMNVPAVQQSL